MGSGDGNEAVHLFNACLVKTSNLMVSGLGRTYCKYGLFSNLQRGFGILVGAD